ncbi:MAG: hypothetical protein JXX28_02510, partial [Deltaproteobacteria bacterium]|nr:hypothetical protein [Deltaproteobacteria bacterium]
MPLSLFKASAPGFLAGMGVAVACAWLWRPAPLPSIYARLAPSVVSVELAGRQGSGFAVGVDEVLTAWHLVVGEEHCVVRGYGGE